MAMSMHPLPWRYAACPWPSRVSRRPEESCDARDFAHSYGVAGSSVVPTTRIGEAPCATTRCVGVTPASGQTWHDVWPQPMKPPSGGYCFCSDAACSPICATVRF
jgi:hypothetical protein